MIFQDPEKEVSDWLSDLTLVDQHPDLEVHIYFCLCVCLTVSVCVNQLDLSNYS